MTTKVTGQTFNDQGKFVPVEITIETGMFHRFNLGPHYALAGLEAEDDPLDEAAHVKINGASQEVLEGVIAQFYQKGRPLPREIAVLGKSYEVPENQELRITGPQSQEGTPVLVIGYERSSAKNRERR